MLIYEYPPKLNRRDRQAKAAADLQEHNKMRRNMYKNFILGGVIILLGFLPEIILIRVLLWIIGALNIFVGILLYIYFSFSKDEKLFTRIYDDRIEHCQREGFSGNYLQICLYFDEIESSFQTNKGRLVCKLKDTEKSDFVLVNKNSSKKYIPENDEISLKFVDTKGKLVLVKDMYEKIKYPHKEYLEYDNEDDDYYSEEDMKWDRLHKHGL